MVIILDLSHPIVWLVRHVCSDKAEFSFLQKKTTFQFVVTVIARNRIKGIGLLFFHDRILRFGKNMPQSLKRFLSNFKGLAIQNSLDGFCNTLNVRNNSKTSSWFSFIRSATSWNWFSAVMEKSFCIAICL